MKKRGKISESVIKNRDKKIIILFFLLLLLCISIFRYCFFNRKFTYAISNIETNNYNEDLKIQISNKEKININEIINKNLERKEIEKIETQEFEIEYLTQYKENPELPKNITQVIQEGKNGLEQITINKKYINEEIIEEKEVNRKTVKATIDKIVEVGTANYSSKFKAKIGDSVYVTSSRISVMAENSDKSKKIATLPKEKELKILEINGDWYKISCGNIMGWVKKECTTNISPKQEYIENIAEGLSKQELIAKLSFNMNLYKPSGLSLEQFEKVLSDKKDVNKVFKNNAKYFYHIEKQYNINGVFVAAVGIHESAWGTSRISLDKKNLFGYGAYDATPYSSAYNFTNYSEGIDLIARVFVKYYLNPPGTKIYGDEIASGKYYYGNNLSSINTKYATDKKWANSVYNHIKYLYNKL